VALDHNHDVLVAAETAILRVDPETGTMQVVSSGGYFTVVLNVAAAKNGDLFATNVRYDGSCGGWVGEIIRVNPHNGRQTLVAQGAYLNYLRGIAVDGDDIYVTGMATHDQNFGIGRVTHVDARTGVQRLISEGENLICPVGIAVDAVGELIVADPYTINPQSRDLFDGAVIRINPTTGGQSLIARGHGSTVNPCGIGIVPVARPDQIRQ
jgi:sugar lactone lactonase YvrE